MITQEKWELLLKEVKELKASNLELIDRCSSQGRQIAEMKDQYNELLIEIKILKEGGNI